MRSGDKIEYGIIGMQEDSYKFNYDTDFTRVNKRKALRFSLSIALTQRLSQSVLLSQCVSD